MRSRSFANSPKNHIVVRDAEIGSYAQIPVSSSDRDNATNTPLSSIQQMIREASPIISIILCTAVVPSNSSCETTTLPQPVQSGSCPRSSLTQASTMFAKWAIAAYAIYAGQAVPRVLSTTTPPPSVSTGAPSITLVTSVASPTAPLTEILPSQVPLPPVQAWCPSEIFCAGAVCHVFFRRSISPHLSMKAPANRQHR